LGKRKAKVVGECRKVTRKETKRSPERGQKSTTKPSEKSEKRLKVDNKAGKSPEKANGGGSSIDL
jgi:hypothetical protein